MRRLLCVVVLTALVLAGTVSAAEASAPAPGPAFNSPAGGQAARARLLVKVRSSVRSAPRHSVIRLAAYSFDRKDIADALLAACRRHVAVQMVLNDNWTSDQTRRLRRALGTSIEPHFRDRCNPVPKGSGREPWAEPSFVKVCVRSCRGTYGNQHMKFYLFSRTGRASNVIMVGSSNLTGYAATFQWNDLYTVIGHQAMFAFYSEVFHQLAQDRRRASPYLDRTFAGLETQFGPHPGTTLAQDPVTRRLAKVRCHATGGTGINGHTAIRVTMYGWNGDRGQYLAHRVVGLRRHGCDIKAILSAPGPKVVGILERGGVGVRSADLDLDHNPNTGFGDTRWERFTHEKWMTLNGVWAGHAGRQVWTGSENWSDVSLRNDEVTLRVPRAGAYRRYVRHFSYVWTHQTRRL
ncbi:MAG: phospholipase D-like domain-containing protein [Nocardioidaceae bacterium]